MDCISTCNEGAIQYKLRYGKNQNAPQADKEEKAEIKTADTGRRAFLAGAAILGASAAQAQEKSLKERLAPERTHKVAQRTVPLVPAGSVSLKHFTDHCTSCQLCVSTCPNNVLRPSSDLTRFMQPEMSYEKGYCRPECTACSQVCPAGAILEVSPEEKSSVQIGHAVVDYSLCVVKTDSVHCGNCAKHCPAGAIKMVLSDPENPKSLRIPSVNEQKCIGCVACENLCPASPVSAIHVEGHEVHLTL